MQDMTLKGFSTDTGGEGQASLLTRARLDFGQHRSLIDTLEASSLPTVVIAPKLTGMPVIFANRAFLDWSGIRSDELWGKPAHLMVSTGPDGAEVARLRAAIEQRESTVVEALLMRPDGRRLLASLALSHFGVGDRWSYPCLSFYDSGKGDDAADGLETRQNIEARLRESNARLRALAEASSEVMYRMSPD